jgi:hypothetical protein
MPFSPSAAIASAVSGDTWRLRYTKSRALSSSFRCSSRASRPRSVASFPRCALESSTSPGSAQIDFTGVETASASPWRSTILPRVAGTSITRE